MKCGTAWNRTQNQQVVPQFCSSQSSPHFACIFESGVCTLSLDACLFTKQISRALLCLVLYTILQVWSVIIYRNNINRHSCSLLKQMTICFVKSAYCKLQNNYAAYLCKQIGSKQDKINLMKLSIFEIKSVSNIINGLKSQHNCKSTSSVSCSNSYKANK